MEGTVTKMTARRMRQIICAATPIFESSANTRRPVAEINTLQVAPT